MHFGSDQIGGSTLSYNGTFRKPTGARTGLTRLASSLVQPAMEWRGPWAAAVERDDDAQRGARPSWNRRHVATSNPCGPWPSQRVVGRRHVEPEMEPQVCMGAECALGALGAEATGSATHARAARRNCSQVHAFHGSSASVADCTRCRWHDAISTRGTTRRAGLEAACVQIQLIEQWRRGEFITSSVA